MKKTLLCLIILFTLNNLTFAITINEENQIYNDAKIAINNQDFKTAINLIQKIVSANPNNLTALNYLATIYSWNNQFDLALNYYQQVLNTDKNNFDANMGKAKIYSWQGHLPQALSILKNLQQLYPNNIELFCNLGRISRWNHEFNLSRIYLNEGLKIDPNNFNLLLELGLLDLDVLDFQSAALVFANLNDHYPDNKMIANYLKMANIELKPKMNAVYLYSDIFDIDYLKNNQNKKIRQNKYSIGYEQNIFPKTALSVKYTVGPQVGYDAFSQIIDYTVSAENLSLKLKYTFTDLFDINLGFDAIRFTNLSDTLRPLNIITTNLNPVVSLTKKTNNYRADLYYYGEFFPLVRGQETQIFNSKTYGLSYFYKFTPTFGLGLCFENAFYSSYNDFRQHYIGWFDTVFFPGIYSFNFQYLFKFFSSPSEYYNIFSITKPFNLTYNLSVNPAIMFTLNSLKNNCLSKLLLDINYQNSDYLSFYINSYYGIENLRNQTIPSLEFKIGANYYIN
ncbi:MAG: tetratricopeptide repeat protein [Candidatus Margulisiibacteriota bacterium]|jgi:Flp pilus assembly protein TadD